MLRKILVLARDAATGLRYQQALGTEGCEVLVHDDAAGAVEAACLAGADLVLVSQTGPGFDVPEVLDQLKATEGAPPVVILDPNPTVDDAVSAMKHGALDYRREPCSTEDLRSALRQIAQSLPFAAPARATRPFLDSPPGFEGMIGQCAAMRQIFALIERIAPTDSTVLVAGESGTGKEMVVRAIHRHSRRRDCPLLACDCTALAPTLLESELFGHVKGSFSGAIATKQGLFEVAHHGTLFLDEVANLSLETQGKLLRVLETRRVRKVGDTSEHEVDIRLIATTNRSLGAMVKVGEFRADLYYRLNVVPVSLPPLRERSGDLQLLAQAFLERFSREVGVEPRGFSDEALRQMEVYPWPGNVRELRNIVERLAVLYGGVRIELAHLPSEIREARPAVSTADVPRTWDELKRLKRQIADDLERRFLIAALERSAQNITQAAESVGMQRPNFHALLRAHGIRPDAGRDRRA